METFDTIYSRHTVRNYTGETITDEQLTNIVAAGNAAPVGRGKFEDAHMTVIRNKEFITEIDANGAKFFNNPDLHPLYNAPILIVVSERQVEGISPNVMYSNGAIIAHSMILAATDLGVGATHIWGATAALAANSELTAKLGLPEGFVPCCSVALGQFPDGYQKREIPTNRIATDYID